MTLDETQRELPPRVVVGRVRKPHGIRGEVAVEVLSDVAERFDPGARLLVRWPAGEIREVRVAASRPHGDALLVRFEGIGDRDSADELRSATLEVRREEVPAPPAGSYYHYQLVDCLVVDRAAGELGRIAEIIEDGGGLLLSVEGSTGRSLVPFVAAYVLDVDVEAGRVETRLPEGLIETCTSTS